MKNLKQLGAAVVLTLALTLPAFAGEITTMVMPPPPASPASATTQGEISTTVAGQITTMNEGEISTPVASADSVTGIALNLLQSVLSLL